MQRNVRLATGDDAEDVRGIYAPIVRDTAISFETEPPSVEEMRSRITSTLEKLPWLICESNGRIEGYAYAAPYRARPAYQWSAETSLYVAADAQRSGVGRLLYETLFAILRAQGYFNVFAGMTSPNPGSAGLHASVGFVPIGVYRNAGWKHGQWHNVEWWQLQLREPVSAPHPPTSTPLVENFNEV